MGQLNNSQLVDLAPSVLSPSSINGNGLHSNRRRIAMESMTDEELRMNKQMLQEISQRKRERLERASLNALTKDNL